MAANRSACSRGNGELAMPKKYIRAANCPLTGRMGYFQSNCGFDFRSIPCDIGPFRRKLETQTVGDA
jgi:hypothetical protein